MKLLDDGYQKKVGTDGFKDIHAIQATVTELISNRREMYTTVVRDAISSLLVYEHTEEVSILKECDLSGFIQDTKTIVLCKDGYHDAQFYVCAPKPGGFVFLEILAGFGLFKQVRVTRFGTEVSNPTYSLKDDRGRVRPLTADEFISSIRYSNSSNSSLEKFSILGWSKGGRLAGEHKHNRYSNIHGSDWVMTTEHHDRNRYMFTVYLKTEASEKTYLYEVESTIRDFITHGQKFLDKVSHELSFEELQANLKKAREEHEQKEKEERLRKQQEELEKKRLAEEGAKRAAEKEAEQARLRAIQKALDEEARLKAKAEEKPIPKKSESKPEVSPFNKRSALFWWFIFALIGLVIVLV